MSAARKHNYAVSVTWTGNQGTGTSGYRDYSRNHDVSCDGPHTIAGSSDPAFRGDRTRWNPELELVAALSQCHMLWYLHLCAEAGVIVLSYSDDAAGTMEETADGSGRFTEVVLRPQVTIASDRHAGGGPPTACASAQEVLHRELGEFPGRARTDRFSYGTSE